MDEITRRNFTAASLGAVAFSELASSPAAHAGDATGPQPGEGTSLDIQRIGIITPTSGMPTLSVAPIISLATVHGGLVYLCGVTADAAKLGDVRDQTRQVLERIDRLLARAGSSKSKMLSAQVWLSDMSLFVDHNEAWNAWVDPNNPPVRACLQSPALWRPGMLVEIMAIAAL